MSNRAANQESRPTVDGSGQKAESIGAAVSRRVLSIALVVGWLVPGGGHLVLGKPARGCSFLALVAATFLIGLGLDGRLPWSFDGSPLTSLASLGAAGSGLLFSISRFVLGYEGIASASGYEYGGAFVLTAGLMNILLLLDVWDIGTGIKS